MARSRSSRDYLQSYNSRHSAYSFSFVFSLCNLAGGSTTDRKDLEDADLGLDTIKTDRVLVREGPLIKQCRRGPKEFEFILFKDSLFYGSTVIGNSGVLGALTSVTASSPGSKIEHDKGDETALTKVTFHRALPLVTLSCKATSTDEFEFAIELRSPEKSFLVYARDAAERNAWLADLTKAVDGAKEAAGVEDDDGGDEHAAVWAADASAKACALCETVGFVLSQSGLAPMLEYSPLFYPFVSFRLLCSALLCPALL